MSHAPRKITALTIAVAALCALGGCGSSHKAKPATAAPASTTATSAPAESAPTATSARQRVLAANEIPGYVPAAPAMSALTLDQFISAAHLSRARAKAQLSQGGFVAGTVEELRGPTPAPPEGEPPSSLAVQFASPAQASRFAAALGRRQSSPPGPGIKVRRLGAPGIPAATALAYSARIRGVEEHQYVLIFASGPFLYRESVFALDRQLSEAQFVAAMRAFYQRVRSL